MLPFSFTQDYMPQIIVWQCATTKQIFLELEEYQKHLRKLAARNRKIKKDEHIKQTFYDWLDDEKSRIDSFDMVAPWLLKNQRIIMDAANVLCLGTFDRDQFYDTDAFTEIILTGTWSPSVSNSHDCPKGGVTNWGARDKFADGTPKPSGYPGYEGYVNGKLQRLKKHNSSYPYSLLYKAVGIHTGSGGGGNGGHGYDIRLFDQEWPRLAEQITYRRLTGITD